MREQATKKPSNAKMLNGVYHTPDDLAQAGFPTFGRVDGNAVQLDALTDDGYFLVHYCGLAALTKGVEQFTVHKSDLLDF